tara:strand:- start:57656 stop:58333 length:678 start_codon:yes stop_codon:yes gene_type:complete
VTQKAHIVATYSHAHSELGHGISKSGNIQLSAYNIFKVFCDLILATISLPIIAVVAVALLVLNPFYNPGRLFFAQHRMGLNGERFKLYKFRTMSYAPYDVRGHDDPLESHRITPFAFYLRKFRIDELPNFINVLLGQMSVVGPRPDAWDHAVRYSRNIKNYAQRFQVRPGITGLAQVRGGYAENVRAVERKARYDHFYVQSQGIRMDLYVIRLTFAVIFTGFGAK